MLWRRIKNIFADPFDRDVGIIRDERRFDIRPQLRRKAQKQRHRSRQPPILQREWQSLLIRLMHRRKRPLHILRATQSIR